MQYKQLRFLEGKGCKRAPIVVTEFDFIHTWGKVFNHGSNLPAPEFPFGQILCQGNDIKEIYAVFLHGNLTEHNN